MDEIPTLTSLSASQKRALVLRDHLHYLAPHHLDSFLAGLYAPEPPPYRVVNGAVSPPLSSVSVRPDALRFDLGNVSCPGKRGKEVVLRAALVYAGGRVEMRTEGEGRGEDGGVPIHVFLAEKMAGLFWEKVEKVRERCLEVNRVRREAWERARRVEKEVPRVQLSQPNIEKMAQVPRLQLPLPNASPSACSTAATRPHKRRRLSTPSTPSTSDALANLLVASQSLIAVYSNPGSEFADLHSAVVRLKSVVDAACPASEQTLNNADMRSTADDASTETSASAHGGPTDRAALSSGATADNAEAASASAAAVETDKRRRSHSADGITTIQPGMPGGDVDDGRGDPRRLGDAQSAHAQSHRLAGASAAAHEQVQGQGLGQGQGDVPALTSAADLTNTNAGGGCVAPVARMIHAGGREC